MDYYNYAFNPSGLTDGSARSRRSAFFRKINLKPQFFRGKQVLEIGPGEGWDILTMVKSGARAIHGLDYSRGNVRNLRTKFRNYANVRVTHGDAVALPFKANQFDFVYANGAIPHVKDPLSALREMVRVTRKGSNVWFSVYGKSGPNNYVNRIARFLRLHIPLRIVMTRLLQNAVTKPILEGVFPRSRKRLFLEAIMTKYLHNLSEHQLVSWCKNLGLIEIERVFPNYGVEFSGNWLTKRLRSDWIQIKARKPK